MRSMLPAALVLVVLVLQPPTAAQNIVSSDGHYVLQFDEANGEKLIDFIDLTKVILGRPIKYLPQEMSDVRIHIAGPMTVQHDDFYLFFQAVLRAYGFIVVDYGPEGSTFLSIQRIQGGATQGRGGGGFAKAQAPIVPVELLHLYSQNPAELITTSIPLKYVDARSAMSTFNPFFDSQIEQVRSVDNSNSLVITGFGTNVWGAYQLVGLVDVPPFTPQPTIRKRELVNASVDEVEPVLTELLAAARGLRPGQTNAAQAAGLSQRDLEPRIIPDPRSNSLLLAGDEDMVDRMESWIDILDVEVEPRGFTHVVQLQNTDSKSIEEVLNEVLSAQESSQTAGRAGQAGPTSGSSLEIPASVVADVGSNSLIITASDRKYAELLETITQLDVRRPQVLVEAAIVETAKSIQELFSVGIGVAGADDGAFVSNFGSNLGVFDPDGGFDIDGTLDQIRGGGGTLALFSTGDVPIPLFLQWLEGNTETHVLSRPSLLTNDNQEAELAAETETAYQVSTTGQNSVTTNSFETVTAGIRLSISPTISAGNYLRLRVRIEVSDFQPASSALEGAPPDIISREIETPVTVPDGHTIILGGLRLRASRKSESKIPWLGDLPLIGWLFRSTSDQIDDRYLYVFITAHIIDTDFALLDEISSAREQDYERLGGDISELQGSLKVSGSTDEVRRLGDLEQIFQMPTVSVPESGPRELPMDEPETGSGRDEVGLDG
jgi:general secretion pathway protein D